MKKTTRRHNKGKNGRSQPRKSTGKKGVTQIAHDLYHNSGEYNKPENGQLNPESLRNDLFINRDLQNHPAILDAIVYQMNVELQKKSRIYAYFSLSHWQI